MLYSAYFKEQISRQIVLMVNFYLTVPSRAVYQGLEKYFQVLLPVQYELKTVNEVLAWIFGTMQQV